MCGILWKWERNGERCKKKKKRNTFIQISQSVDLFFVLTFFPLSLSLSLACYRSPLLASINVTSSHLSLSHFRFLFWIATNTHTHTIVWRCWWLSSSSSKEWITRYEWKMKVLRVNFFLLYFVPQSPHICLMMSSHSPHNKCHWELAVAASSALACCPESWLSDRVAAQNDEASADTAMELDLSFFSKYFCFNKEMMLNFSH